MYVKLLIELSQHCRTLQAWININFMCSFQFLEVLGTSGGTDKLCCQTSVLVAR